MVRKKDSGGTEQRQQTLGFTAPQLRSYLEVSSCPTSTLAALAVGSGVPGGVQEGS